MKSFILILASLVTINAYAQIEIIGDTITTKEGKMTVKSLKRPGTILCKIYGDSSRLTRQYECITPLKTINLAKWDSLVRTGEITRHGIEHVFYKSGKLKMVMLYNGGEKTLTYARYYLSGKLSQESKQVNGTQVINFYYESGSLSQTDTIINKKSMKWTIYDEKREYRMQAPLVNNFFHGDLLLFKDDKLIRKESFSNGVSNQAVCFNDSGSLESCPPFTIPVIAGKDDENNIKSIRNLLDYPSFKKYFEKDTFIFDVVLNEKGELDSLNSEKISDTAVVTDIRKWMESKPYLPYKLSGIPMKSRIFFYLMPGMKEFDLFPTDPNYFFPSYFTSNFLLEQMPEFPGGLKAMKEYLARNIRFPDRSSEEGISGRVVLQFIVTEEGKIKDIKVMHSVSEEIDREAIRVVRSMPAWKPAKHFGKPVPMPFTVPVLFTITD